MLIVAQKERKSKMSELIENPILEEEEEQEQYTGFVVDDDQKAEWCMQKIQEAEAERKRWKAFYDDRMAKVNASCDAKIQHMEYLLGQYFRTVPHKVTKTQESYALPSGKLVYKQQAPEFVREDGKIAEWLEQGGMVGLIEKKPKWGEMKKTLGLMVAGDQVITADGEIVPGVAAVERAPVFKVEVKA